MTPVSFTTKCNYKNAMRTYLMTKPWSFHLTLNLNTDWNINRFQILIKHLENDIKSKYFRGASHKANMDSYFFYCGFLEYTTSGNPHYHIAVYVSEPNKIDKIINFINNGWNKKTKTIGDIYVTQCDDDKEKFINYITKDFNSDSGKSGFITSGM